MNLSSSHFEEQVDRFEDAWNQGDIPSLQDYLPPDGDENSTALIHELIKIDMEYRWRKRSVASLPGERKTVEDYATFLGCQNAAEDIPIDLIAEEYHIRRRWGDNPAPITYAKRFPNKAAEVDEALKKVDRELLLRQSFVDKQQVDSSNEVSRPETIPANRLTLAIGDQIDDFRILKELGQGAFARVFLAQQVSMQRLVALKVSDQKSLESPVLSQLEHPNIVRVFDERNVGSMSLMYMQYVAGGSLRDAMNQLVHVACCDRTGQHFSKAVADILRRKGETVSQSPSSELFATLSWPFVVARLGARIADALSHAHRLGIRHRDIKPENILLTASGQPMLADFNLSFGASVQGARVEKAFGGSLAYMSPEQLHVLMGESHADYVDETSDIFSLGTVLFELLTNRRPFEPTATGESYWSASEHLKARENAPSLSLSLKINSSSIPTEDTGRNAVPNSATSDEHSLRRAGHGLRQFLVECLAYHKSDRPKTAEQTARRLQILSIPSLAHLLSPTQDGWIFRFIKHPIAWYILFGMIPNAILSMVNIWANKRITIDNFDHQFFHCVEEPVVNLIAYPAGILTCWWLALPISVALEKFRAGIGVEETMRSHAARRCLSLPFLVAAIVLGLWAGSGIVFPAWNQWASGSRVDSMDYLRFFLSQILHGLIAACLSLVFVCAIVLNAFYPKLMSKDADCDEHERLATVDQQLGWAKTCLEMTPLIALLAIALSDKIDKPVFVALALIGFASHLVSSLLIPRLRKTIQWLQLALKPTATLLNYRDAG